MTVSGYINCWICSTTVESDLNEQKGMSAAVAIQQTPHTYTITSAGHEQSISRLRIRFDRAGVRLDFETLQIFTNEGRRIHWDGADPRRMYAQGLTYEKTDTGLRIETLADDAFFFVDLPPSQRTNRQLKIRFSVISASLVGAETAPGLALDLNEFSAEMERKIDLSLERNLLPLKTLATSIEEQRLEVSAGIRTLKGLQEVQARESKREIDVLTQLVDREATRLREETTLLRDEIAEVKAAVAAGIDDSTMDELLRNFAYINKDPRRFPVRTAARVLAEHYRYGKSDVLNRQPDTMDEALDLITDLKEEVIVTRAVTENLLHSSSWIVTKPLRFVGRCFSRLARFVGFGRNK